MFKTPFCPWTSSEFQRANELELKDWLGGLDSNQDSQSQSLESYQLDDLPAGRNKKESRRVRLSRRLRFNLSNLIGNAKSVNRHGNDYSLATMNAGTSDVQLAKKNRFIAQELRKGAEYLASLGRTALCFGDDNANAIAADRIRIRLVRELECGCLAV